MIKVSIVGSGKVAQHLSAALSDADQVELLAMYSRSPIAFELPKSTILCRELSALPETDICIIAVSDSAIADISKALPFKNKLVLHTSGTVSLSDLSSTNRRGVFYPLQTFSIGRPIDFKTVPICIEAENPADYRLLEKLAKGISNSVYSINSEQRKALHVAAVFANNFTNHMYLQAESICTNHNISFDILKPLIAETASKINFLLPAEAQTGPAVRNDQKTMNEHLKFLPKHQQSLYTAITKSIQNDQKL